MAQFIKFYQILHDICQHINDPIIESMIDKLNLLTEETQLKFTLDDFSSIIDHKSVYNHMTDNYIPIKYFKHKKSMSEESDNAFFLNLLRRLYKHEVYILFFSIPDKDDSIVQTNNLLQKIDKFFEFENFEKSHEGIELDLKADDCRDYHILFNKLILLYLSIRTENHIIHTTEMLFNQIKELLCILCPFFNDVYDITNSILPKLTSDVLQSSASALAPIEILESDISVLPDAKSHRLIDYWLTNIRDDKYIIVNLTFITCLLDLLSIFNDFPEFHTACYYRIKDDSSIADIYSDSPVDSYKQFMIDSFKTLLEQNVTKYPRSVWVWLMLISLREIGEHSTEKKMKKK